MKRLQVIPEIFIWLAFTVAAGFGYAFAFLGYIDSHSRINAADIVIPTLVWVLLAAICTFLLRATRSSQRFVQFSKCEGLFLECSVVALLMVGGWVFRFVDYFYNAWPGEVDYTYFQHALVSGEAMAYMNPHPVSRLYVAFLHIVCMFLGNIYEAGAFIQFVLLLAGVVIWYLAVRKSQGVITALFFVAGAMLLPDSIVASMQCNPMMLLFVLYGILALWLVNYFYGSARGFLKCLQIFWLGFYAAILCFLDISGVLAVLAFAIVLLCRALRDRRNHLPYKLTPLIGGAGVLAAVVTFVVAQSGIYGMDYQMAGSFHCYQGLGLALPNVQAVQDFVFHLGSHPIFMVAIAGISVYWFLDRKGPATWLMLAELFLLAVQLLKLDTYLQHDFLIYMGVILLLGISVQQYLCSTDKKVSDAVTDSEQICDEPSVSEKEKETDGAETVDVKEPVVTVIHFDEQPAVVVQEKPAEKPLIFIPKTMEIPKRVSKPKVDFAIAVEESQMHYDYPVEDNADFDF